MAHHTPGGASTARAPFPMRALFAVLAVVALACTPAPTPEFARAKQAYDDAMGATADTSYAGPRWAEVVRLLRAVPASNARERKTAALLADEIDSTRARTAAEIGKAAAAGDKLLDVPSLPPLPASAPRAAAPDAASPKAVPAASASSTGTATTINVPGDACGRRCQDDLDACTAAAGCTHNGGSFACPDASKIVPCREQLASCVNACAP